jgi:hypothetical protein
VDFCEYSNDIPYHRIIYQSVRSTFEIKLFFSRCSHTWERAPVSEHMADFTQFLNQDGR